MPWPHRCDAALLWLCGVACFGESPPESGASGGCPGELPESSVLGPSNPRPPETNRFSSTRLWLNLRSFYLSEAVGNAIVVLQLFDAVDTRLRSNQNAQAFSIASTNDETLPPVMFFSLEHFSSIYFLALVARLSGFNRISTIHADFAAQGMLSFIAS